MWLLKTTWKQGIPPFPQTRERKRGGRTEKKEGGKEWNQMEKTGFVQTVYACVKAESVSRSYPTATTRL